MELYTKKNTKYANSLWAIILPLVVFIALGAFIMIERTGLILSDTERPVSNIDYLPPDKVIPRSEHRPDTRCLLLYNSLEEYSPVAISNITFALDQMSVGFNLVDLAATTELPPFSDYKTVMIACAEVMPIMLSLTDLFDWVAAGGGLIFTQTPEEDWFTAFFHEELGIDVAWTAEEKEMELVPQVNAFLETDLLVGGKGHTVPWSEDNPGEYRYGGNFKVSSASTVHISSTGPEGPTALLWEKRWGRGRIVVNNNDAMQEKWSRGLIAAAYSLTEAAVAYPVINASMFFIDDFPSPVPQGYNKYVQRDYNVQMEYFFVNVWFPDMLRMAAKHKIKYTGLFIQSYNDNTIPPYIPEPISVTERMKYFGALFLNEGFEIGLHGHNHQSLVLESFDYKGLLPYNKWRRTEEMADALGECVKLQKELFPNITMTTYVPPSNVLSKEGRAMLRASFPELKVISDLLVDDLFDLWNNFGVDEDGFINIPRLTTGYYPFDDEEDQYQFWFALSEINMHFVNSHFIHPDDVMDPLRGAEIGWKLLTEYFENYLSWLDQFPIRNMTAQEAGPAVQRFDNLTVHTELAPNDVTLSFDGFYDEAWLLVRLNDGAPAQTVGGSLTRVNGNLYLLKAEAPKVTINLNRSRS